MKRSVHIAAPLVLYGLILVAAWRYADSRLLFLTFGFGGVLLAERHAFRRLGWPAPSESRVQMLMPWLAGAAAATLPVTLNYGRMPWSEVAHVALFFACAAALLQWTVHRLRNGRNGRRGMLLGLLPLGVAFLAAAFFAPVIAAVHPLRRMAQTTPAEFGLPYENVEFTTSDGLRLRGWLIPADHARGTAVFCHGHTAHRGHVTGFLPALHDMGLNVLAFDFRGHGESGGHTVGFGAREVEDVAAAHDYAARRAPGRPIVLIGSSYGAAMIVQSLHRLPDVAAAWVDASFARFTHVVDHRFRGHSPAVRTALIGIYSLAVWADIGRWPQSINPIDTLAGVRVPITFVHGGRDDLVPFSEGESLYAACAGPKQCFWVERGGHDKPVRSHLRRVPSPDACLHRTACRPPLKVDGWAIDNDGPSLSNSGITSHNDLMENAPWQHHWHAESF